MADEEVQASDAHTEMPKVTEVQCNSSHVSKWRCIGRVVRESLLNTSFHALPHMVRNNHLAIRAMWLFFFLSCLGCSTYVTFELVVTYFEYLVDTKIAYIFEDPTLFPTISLCDQNPPAHAHRPELAQILSHCKFGSHFCTANDFERWNNSHNNQCYRFNSGINSNGERIPIKKSDRRGLMGGLELELFTVYDHTSQTQNSNGYLIAIHNQTEFFYYQSGYYIRPGEKTRVMVDRVFIQRLPLPYNDCLNSLETYPAFNRTFYDLVVSLYSIYHRQDCLNHCNHLEVLARCNCSTADIKNPLVGFCDESIELDQCESHIDESLIARCGRFCPLECETVKYTATFSTAHFPSNSHAQKLMKNSNFTRLFNGTPDVTSVRQRVLRLEVFYTELTYTTVVDEPYLLCEDLIVQFGGVLSLFLGSSFLSFMEIFDMIAEIAIIACSRPVTITKIKPFVKGN